MLERYRFVSADEDADDLMDDISFGHETAEYGYHEDDDDLEAPSEPQPALLDVPAVPPPPPPLSHDEPLAIEKAAGDEVISIASPKKHASKVPAKAAKKTAVATKAVIKKAVPARKAVPAKKAAPAKKVVVSKSPARKIATKKKAAPPAKKIAKKAAKKTDNKR